MSDDENSVFLYVSLELHFLNSGQQSYTLGCTNRSFIHSLTLALARSSVHSIVFFRGVLGGEFAQVEVHKAFQLTASEQGHAAEVLDGLHHDNVL